MINQRIAEQQQIQPGIFSVAGEGTDYGMRQRMMEDMSGYEQFMVGAGREMSQLGTGFNQLLTNIFGTPAEAEAYRQMIAEENRLYERARPEGIATSTGEVAGMMAPGLLAGPLGPSASVGGRLGTAVVTGGIEGALQPTESPEFAKEKLIQTSLGALIGGGFQGIFEGIGAGGRKLASSFASSKEGAAEVVEAAKEHGIFVGMADLSDSSIMKLIDKGATFTPLTGTRQSKLRQLTQGLEAARNLTSSMIINGNYDQALGTSIQNSLAAHKAMLKDASDKFYDRVFDPIQAAGKIDAQINPVNTNQVLQNIGEEPLGPLMLDVKRVPGAPDYQPDLIKVMRSSREIAQRNLERGTVAGKDESAIRQAIEEAARKDIHAHLRGIGGQQLVDQFEGAQRNYAQGLATYNKRFSDIDSAINTDDYDSIYQKYIRGVEKNNTSKPQILFDHLTPEGQEAVRYQILDEAIDRATSGKGTFDPGAFTKAIAGNQGAVDVFFKDENKRLLTGLTKVYKHIDRAKEAELESVWTQIASNPVLYGPLFGGIGIGFGPGAAAAALGGGASAGGLAKLFLATDTGRDLLLKASQAPPGGRVFTERLSRAIPTAMEAFAAQYATELREKQIQQQSLFPEGGGA